MRVKRVVLWWVGDLGCWCFSAWTEREGHVVSGRVFWDGLATGRPWSTEVEAAGDDKERDARQAFGWGPGDTSIVVVEGP